jgi:hypothetical protein
VYDEGVMNERNVRKLHRLFEGGRTNVRVEERGGCLSLVTNDLKGKVNGKTRGNRRFTIF